MKRAFALLLTLVLLGAAFAVPASAADQYASYRTSTRGASSGRLGNMQRAALAINQVYVASGATFSFNDTVGPRTKAEGYVKALTYQGVTYAELAHGESSGWLYYVNGKLPNVGITDYELSEGDVVSFLYTADYTQESGGSGLGGGTISKPDPKPDDTKPDGTEPETPAWSNPFDDVSVNDWFYSYIAFVTEKGMMRGMAESLFAPDASLSRGMFVTILYRLENEPDAKDCVFTDVAPDAWYANAVAWAQAAGIVGGVTETEFAPGASITREQMAAMLYRYAGYKSYDLSAGEDTNILSFEDAQQIAEYAVSAMQWACGSALIGGSNGLLLPSSNCTRAQAAAILSRFCAAYSAQ